MPALRAGTSVGESVQQQLADQVRFVFRNFPLAEMHPHAKRAAAAAEAAGAQGKFWPMHDIIYEHQDALDDDDLLRYAELVGLDTVRFSLELADGTYAKRVSDDFRSGVRSGVNGTPAFFINGERYDGSWLDMDAFISALLAAAHAHVSR